jgi:hypothetical protein
MDWLYNEVRLQKQAEQQKAHAWDLKKDIHWEWGVDLTKPLVPLETQNLLFPNISQEERVILSQVMGLIINTCVFEMEECLMRLRPIAWTSIIKKYPVNPEFVELGDLFFEEERKHSQAFKIYLLKFCEALDIEPEKLQQLLPIVERTKSEKLLENNLKNGGEAFWWIVAIVEQEFLHLYRCLKPFKGQIDPLYYELHEKHFEEEARHASFPYMLLQIIHRRRFKPSIWPRQRWFYPKTGLVFAQTILTTWTFASLQRLKKIKKLKHKHSFFDGFQKLLPQLEQQSLPSLLSHMLKRAPYVSELLNTQHHPKILKFAEKHSVWSIPFPDPDPQGLSVGDTNDVA